MDFCFPHCWDFFPVDQCKAGSGSLQESGQGTHHSFLPEGPDWRGCSNGLYARCPGRTEVYGRIYVGVFLAKGQETLTSFQIPLWLMILCSLVMAIGTSIGGYRIIKAVGMDMVRLETYQGFAANGRCCLSSALLTYGHTRIHYPHKNHCHHGGGRAAKRLSAVNWNVVKEMVLTWILTFPGCGLIGFIIAKLFMYIF